MHKTHLAYALFDITAIISVVMCKVDIISLQLEIFTALKDKHKSHKWMPNIKLDSIYCQISWYKNLSFDIWIKTCTASILHW